MLEENENKLPESIEENNQNQEVKEDVVFTHGEHLKHEYSSNYLEAIETSRLEFSKKYKSNNYVKWIVSLVAIGILVFAFIGIPNIIKSEPGKSNPLQISLMVSLGVLSLVMMLGYSFLMKRMLNKKARAYFSSLYDNVTKYVFDDEKFSLVNCDAQKKIEKIQFDENLLYKDIFDVGSRATTDLVYDGLNMMVCDCAAQVKGEKRVKPVFVGKYLIGPADYDKDEVIAIYVKGDERSLPPTNLDDLKCVYDDDKMSIHSNNSNWGKVITTKIKKQILDIKEGKSLVDYSVSLRAGTCYVCLGYDDDIMVLPLEQPFNPKPTEEYKIEVNRAIKLIRELNK